MAADQPASVPPAIVGSSCPACDHVNQPNTKFCAKCGTDLHATTVKAADIIKTVAPVVPVIDKPDASEGEPAIAAVPIAHTLVEAPPGPTPADDAKPAQALAHQPPEPIPPVFIEAAIVAPAPAPAPVPAPVPTETPTTPVKAAPQQPLPIADDNNAASSTTVSPPTAPVKPPNTSALLKGTAVLLLLILAAGGGWWFSQQRGDAPHATLPATATTVPTASEAPAEQTTDTKTSEYIDASIPQIAPPSTTEPVTAEAEPAARAEEIAQRDAALAAKKEATRKKQEAAALVKRREREADEQARAQARANAATAASRASAPTSTQRPSIEQDVAACKTKSFFEREKCLWSLCNNRWGNHGCPSYSN